jgi:hypothetical protein
MAAQGNALVVLHILELALENWVDRAIMGELSTGAGGRSESKE